MFRTISKYINQASQRILSVLAVSFLSAYLLSFVFEGQVLYSLVAFFNVSAPRFIFAAIIAHMAGLIGCGFWAKTPAKAKKAMLYGIAVSLLGSFSFFFPVSILWIVSLLACAMASGGALAAWGFFLKSCTSKNERIKTCADVLIISNVLMILINFMAIHLSPFMGLGLAMLALVLAGYFASLLPVTAQQLAEVNHHKDSFNLMVPLLILVIFVVIITINSGLMYQVFNPAFKHLTWLTSWYWAVPYITAIYIMRNLPAKVGRSYFLYAAIAMIMASFIAFMLLDRSAASYLVVDTLMLGACGIFDLFWWSIIGEMLEYSDNPARIFGVGLAANVLGVLLGGLLGSSMTSANISSANVAVIALSVICITLAILPLLNRQLVALLKSHTYLMVYSNLEKPQQDMIVTAAATIVLDPLTQREQEVLRLILKGKTNKAISAELFISENTVKTHVKNIYFKYKVSSRAQLLSTLFANHNVNESPDPKQAQV